MPKHEPNTDRSKWKIDETPQDTSFIPTLAVTLWLGWNGILIYLFLLLLIFHKNIMVVSIILSLSLASILTPRTWPGKLGIKIGNWLMIQASKYFGLKTTIEDEESICSILDKAAIFAFEPHDILPYPVFCFNPCLRRIPGLVGESASALVTSAIFGLPFIKHVYTWVRCHAVDKKTFINKLKCKESFVFVPGGVQEVTMIDPDKPDDVILYLKSRKGFIKLALLHGSPIIPVFCFNCDNSYGHYIPKYKFLTTLGRKIGILPMVFWGRFGIPFGIPKPRNIHVVIGRPIHVPLVSEDDDGHLLDDMIVKYHEIFLNEIGALYERHKVENGYGHRSLKII